MKPEIEFLQELNDCINNGMVKNDIKTMIKTRQKLIGQKCEVLHSTDFNGKCFNCGKQVFDRLNK